ncbi:MAG: hypothetical protein AAF360_18275 [Pseudomonadota bacterium]
MLANAATRSTLDDAPRIIVAAALSLLACLAFASLFERRLGAFRAFVGAHIPVKPTPT